MSDLLQFFGEDISDLGEQYKICRTCNTAKPISNFSKSGKYLQSDCKLCCSVAWKKYHAENREKLKDNHKKYKHEKRTPEQKELYFKRKQYKKEILELHEQGKRRCSICNIIKEYDSFSNAFSKKCYFNKKTYCKQCAHEKWRIPRSKTEKYKLQKSIGDKRYRDNPRVKERTRERQKEKYYSDIQFKLKLTIRNRINAVLKAKNQKKISSSISNLGCNVEELIRYLEKQFHTNEETGEMMTWENHAQKGWHIDHIKPLSSFDLENPEEFEEACNYKNLQPLWWKDNLSKGDKT